MDGAQGLGEPVAEVAQRAAAQRAAGLDDVLEGGAGHVAGDEVGPLAVDVGGEDLGDAGGTDAFEGGDLAGQALAGLRVGGDVRLEDLERDGAVLVVQAEVDDAHPALADLAVEAVGAEAVPGQGACAGGRHVVRGVTCAAAS